MAEFKRGRLKSFNNHVVRSGDKSIKGNAEKYDTGKLGKQATGGYFRIVSTHTYRKVTADEILLKEEYAKSLISNYENVPLRAITLEKITYTYTVSRTSTMYKVKVRDRGWGRIAVTTLELPGEANNRLQFTLLKRAGTTNGKNIYKSNKRRRSTWHG